MRKREPHIGEKIKKARRSKEFTQSDLAVAINKTRAMISNIELTGKVNHYTLLTILKALGISEEELLNINVSTSGEPETGYGNKSELQLLRDKIASLLREIEMLKELVSSKNMLIEELRKKRR